ncbi:DedA family protein [Herpetosiphon sp. NSE202]|uniref:DedA family protein n=1 Tax=Herpetosiphon sp. NSE202 TaxID=3351349 RepID=UPI003633AD56
MWDSIVQAFNSAVTQLEANVYWLTLSYLFLSEFGAPLPIPGNFVLVASGYLLGRQNEIPILLMALAILALVPGATTMFWIGRRGGLPLLNRIGPKIGLSQRRRDRIVGWLERRAVLGLIIIRVLPTFRLGTTIIPGALGMPWPRYALGMGSGLVAWVITYMGLGYAIGLLS